MLNAKEKELLQVLIDAFLADDENNTVNDLIYYLEMQMPYFDISGIQKSYSKDNVAHVYQHLINKYDYMTPLRNIQ